VLTGGWLARLGGTDEQGNWIDIRTGFLSTGGEFRAFHIPARGTPSYHTMGSAISPDRTQVAYDGWIVDVASGDPVAPLPGRPWVIQGWTDEGVEYADRQHGCCTSYLWQPGHPRLELPGVDEVHLGVFDLDAPPIAVKYGTSCSRYFRIEDAARLVFVARLCNEGLAAVSISGLMVTSTGRVLDAQGHQIAHLDIPVPTQRDGFGDRGCCSLYWEADNLLVAVERGGPSARPARRFWSAVASIRAPCPGSPANGPQSRSTTSPGHTSKEHRPRRRAMPKTRSPVQRVHSVHRFLNDRRPRPTHLPRDRYRDDGLTVRPRDRHGGQSGSDGQRVHDLPPRGDGSP
jgi:hypothetical protein